MDLISYCKAHGILIDHVPPIGQWKRYQTDDHPHKRNGAVKFMGTHAFVQNHAVDSEVSVWKPDDSVEINYTKIARMAQEADKDRQKKQQEAQNKADRMIQESVFAFHPYLKSKGFPEETGNVWVKDKNKILLIPMRVDNVVVGCQMISEDGDKKFLLGQRTSDATFVFNNGGDPYLCEGYATALSLRYALRGLKKKYSIHVCFSAGNLLKVAQKTGRMVVADNDESGTGERIAKQTGLPYWMSDRVGEDANDYHQRVGLFKFTQSLNKSIMVGR